MCLEHPVPGRVLVLIRQASWERTWCLGLWARSLKFREPRKGWCESSQFSISTSTIFRSVFYPCSHMCRLLHTIDLHFLLWWEKGCPLPEWGQTTSVPTYPPSSALFSFFTPPLESPAPFQPGAFLGVYDINWCTLSSSEGLDFSLLIRLQPCSFDHLLFWFQTCCQLISPSYPHRISLSLCVRAPFIHLLLFWWDFGAK